MEKTTPFEFKDPAEPPFSAIFIIISYVFAGYFFLYIFYSRFIRTSLMLTHHDSYTTLTFYTLTPIYSNIATQ